MLTEEEAKAKWCPFTNGSAVAKERIEVPGDLTTANSRCIASACMAWRWADDESDDETATTENRVSGNAVFYNPPSGDGWASFRTNPRTTEWRRKIRSSGYCGLAGKP